MKFSHDFMKISHEIMNSDMHDFMKENSWIFVKIFLPWIKFINSCIFMHDFMNKIHEIMKGITKSCTKLFTNSWIEIHDFSHTFFPCGGSVDAGFFTCQNTPSERSIDVPSVSSSAKLLSLELRCGFLALVCERTTQAWQAWFHVLISALLTTLLYSVWPRAAWKQRQQHNFSGGNFKSVALFGLNAV